MLISETASAYSTEPGLFNVLALNSESSKALVHVYGSKVWGFLKWQERRAMTSCLLLPCITKKSLEYLQVLLPLSLEHSSPQLHLLWFVAKFKEIKKKTFYYFSICISLHVWYASAHAEESMGSLGARVPGVCGTLGLLHRSWGLKSRLQDLTPSVP